LRRKLFIETRKLSNNKLYLIKIFSTSFLLFKNKPTQNGEY